MYVRDLPAENAIRVGQLYYKPRDIERTIARSCRMVLFEADTSALPLGYGGSATLIRYKHRNFVVTTRHQLGKKAGEELPKEILDTIRFSSLLGDALTNIPCVSAYYSISHPEEEFHEILFFEADDQWSNMHTERPYFFEVERFSPRQRLKSFVLGYPYFEDTMNGYLTSFFSQGLGTIHMRQVLFDCLLDASQKSNAKNVRVYKFSRDQHPVDGLSGGAIFWLVGELGNCELVLDGIVTRAGRNAAYIVDADYIVDALEKIQQ